jgi:DNA repair ATPase RecN
MKSKLIMFIALIGLAVMFSSCASVPQAKIDAVTSAIDSVKSVGGDVFVPEVYKALTDSFAAVNAQVETEKAKWFPTYKKANQSLDVLAQAAVDALAKTEARKVELKAENDALVTEVKDLLSTNAELLKKAPKGKEGREALNAIKGDLEVAATTLTESEALITTGDILGANSKLKAVKDRVSSIKTELETAVNKVK